MWQTEGELILFVGLEMPRPMCGIVGIVSTEPVNQQVYDARLLLLHRGQDSTGIATAEGSHLHQFKTKGQVREAFRTRDMRALPGNVGLGHVRYATAGAAKHEEEAQPFYVNAPYGIVLVHNGNLTNTRELTSDLFSIVTSIRRAIPNCCSTYSPPNCRDRSRAPTSTPTRSLAPWPTCTIAFRGPMRPSR